MSMTGALNCRCIRPMSLWLLYEWCKAIQPLLSKILVDDSLKTAQKSVRNSVVAGVPDLEHLQHQATYVAFGI